MRAIGGKAEQHDGTEIAKRGERLCSQRCGACTHLHARLDKLERVQRAVDRKRADSAVQRKASQVQPTPRDRRIHRCHFNASLGEPNASIVILSLRNSKKENARMIRRGSLFTRSARVAPLCRSVAARACAQPRLAHQRSEQCVWGARNDVGLCADSPLVRIRPSVRVQRGMRRRCWPLRRWRRTATTMTTCLSIRCGAAGKVVLCNACLRLRALCVQTSKFAFARDRDGCGLVFASAERIAADTHGLGADTR